MARVASVSVSAYYIKIKLLQEYRKNLWPKTANIQSSLKNHFCIENEKKTPGKYLYSFQNEIIFFSEHSSNKTTILFQKF